MKLSKIKAQGSTVLREIGFFQLVGAKYNLT